MDTAILTPAEKMSAALAKANARTQAAERELGLMTAAYESQTLNLENAKDVEAECRAEVERLRTVLRELEAMRKNFNAGWDRVVPW